MAYRPCAEERKLPALGPVRRSWALSRAARGRRRRVGAEAYGCAEVPSYGCAQVPTCAHVLRCAQVPRATPQLPLPRKREKQGLGGRRRGPAAGAVGAAAVAPGVATKAPSPAPVLAPPKPPVAAGAAPAPHEEQGTQQNDERRVGYLHPVRCVIAQQGPRNLQPRPCARRRHNPTLLRHRGPALWYWRACPTGSILRAKTRQQKRIVKHASALD